jgi:ribosomal protein S12 methylthiotransferase accessory factor
LLTEYSDQNIAAAAAPLLRDSNEVRTMNDHSLLYSHPDAFDRLTFLPVDGPARPLADCTHQWQWPAFSNLAEDLSELVGRYINIGLDVIVVNQTSPEHRAGDLTCVKVLVPGTLPMTFGHRFRRTDGIPRLFSVPRQLGYQIQDMRPEQINPYPHPFP